MKTFIVFLIVAVAAFTFLQTNKKPLDQEDVKKQVNTTEAILSEAILLTQIAAESDVTKQFLQVHADSLAKQLEQSKKSLTDTSFEGSVKEEGQKEIFFIDQSIDLLKNLGDQSDNKDQLNQAKKSLQTIFNKELALEKSL